MHPEQEAGLTMTTRRFLLLLTIFVLASAVAVPQATTVRSPTIIGLAFQGDGDKVGFWVAGAFTGKGGYVSSEKAAPLAKRSLRYKLHSVQGVRATVTQTSQEKSGTPQGWIVNTTGAPGLKEFPMLALSDNGKKAVPRIPRRQIADNPVYEKALSEMLKREGSLSVARPHITGHFRVDLNGDGTDEVLLTGATRSNFTTYSARVGDATFAAIRFSDGKTVRTMPLDLNVATKKSAKQFPFSAPAEYKILACVDIDGDGRMEIAVYSTAHESEVLEIFSFDGKSVKKVLSEGWGV